MVTVLAACAALVAGVFAARLARQYAARRRAHALAWAVSLTLFGLASAAVTVGVALGWSPVLFGVYWLAGALLNVPLLACGQLLLMDASRARLWWGLAGLAAGVSVVTTATAGFDATALAEASADRGIPLGREVLGGSLAYRLVAPLNATFLVVVVGSVWSAWRTRRWGVLLIAVGTSVAAAGSSAVGSGRDALFAVLLAVGVTTMYAGFVAAGRVTTPVTATATASPAGPQRRPLVTVYTRDGCHLCTEAAAVAARVSAGRADVALVDVDADPALTDRYTVRVPVVAVDGREIAEYHLDPATLQRALEDAAGTEGGAADP